ncbi:acyltransferase family protein [Tessaracoccus sp. O5.2]|uniref:acyltransferase family protein n=1 Tax=Tessaracoccus sp. O5.2 TaxID=3157622 RepID=UPI0036DE5E13
MTSSVDTPGTGRLRDLQGLRAVAVLAVMVTHAGLPVPGGFTGVDVFFVISGFIITLMLLREHATTGTISFRRFYIRRLKRLGPALAVTSTVTVLLSLLFLSPLGPQETAFKTALGATVGVANWVIADHTGDYFGTAAERNPMLHTWSLSVEEQFYVVLPALLLLSLVLGRRLSRRSPKAVALLLLGLLAVGSLASIQVGTDFPLGYYGPVTRAWEFLAGCLLALGIGLVQRLPSLVLRAAGVIGAALMVWGFMAITPETPFPGKWALLPVVGTALLILAGRDGGGPLTAILSSRPMVAIGDWSYSLYLWHWPFIVVAKAGPAGHLHPGGGPDPSDGDGRVSVVGLRRGDRPLRRTTSGSRRGRRGAVLRARPLRPRHGRPLQRPLRNHEAGGGVGTDHRRQPCRGPVPRLRQPLPGCQHRHHHRPVSQTVRLHGGS